MTKNNQIDSGAGDEGSEQTNFREEPVVKKSTAIGLEGNIAGYLSCLLVVILLKNTPEQKR